MAEPTVVCPQCKSEIKLTESLAAPLLESVRRDYEQRLSQKDADISKREKLLNERAESVEKAKQNLDQQVEQKLQLERVRIVAEEGQACSWQ
jgi:exonuclease VII large subunit